VQQGRLLQQEGVRTGNLQLVSQGQNLERQALKQGAAQGIQALVTQIADPETDDTLAAESRKTALRLARDNNVPEERVRTALDAAEKQRLTSVYSKEVPKLKALSLDAQKMISSGQDKNAFVSKHGSNYGFVFDTMAAEIAQTEQELAKAKEYERLSKYQYSDEKLTELGISEADIKEINSLPSGRAKNAAVVAALLNKKTNAPNATLIKFYADSFVADIMTENDFDYDDEDEFKQAQALADKKARELFLDNNGDPAAMASASVESKKNEDEDIDVDAAILEITRSLTDGS
jgi:hypothetical protein